MANPIYNNLIETSARGEKMLAILVDPEKFDTQATVSFLHRIPRETSYIFVGGSTASNRQTEATVIALKQHTNLPVILFPGNHNQITHTADALLFLSLLSGRNAEFLVGQQVRAVPRIRNTQLEIIPTGYILIAGGAESAVARVSQTEPLSQSAIQPIVDTALAGQFMGAKLIYLEAGSGAAVPVSAGIIKAVRAAIHVPLIVGGGIINERQKKTAYGAGADLIVMGTAFENI